jgi:hypothetical protein
VDAQIKLSWSPPTAWGSPAGPCWPRCSPGERDPRSGPAGPDRPARQRGRLEEALVGRFGDHHGFLLARMVGRIDQASADIATLDRQIEAEIAPFRVAADRLDEICGVGRAAAPVIIAEIGLDMGRFPTQASWSPGPGSGLGSRSRPADPTATPPPATATPPWPGGWARPPWPPGGPLPSWGSATGASPDAAGQAGPRRGRPLHPDHRLPAPAGRPDRSLPRSGRRLLRHPDQP